MKNEKPDIAQRVARDLQDGIEGSIVARAPRRARSGLNWPYKQTEDDHAERWQDTEFRFNNKLDGFLFLPLLFFFIAVTNWGDPAFLFVFGSTALAQLIWFPWITFRVAMRAPAGDHRRAAAILAFALPVWIVPALFLSVSVKASVYAGFPPLYLASGAAMLMAVRQNPRPLSPRRRRALQATGGAIYLLVAAVLLLIVSQAFLGGRGRAEALGNFGWLLTMFGLLVGVVWAVVGFKLITAPADPPRSRRRPPASFSA